MQLNGKLRSLTKFTFHLNFTIMQINDFLDISKSETEAFHIMHISCMNAIELIKYLLLVLFLHSHTRIFD